jgi:hypothetical protein
LSANSDGNLQIEIDRVSIFEDELVQLLVVLQLGVAVQEKDRVLFVGQALFVQGLEVCRQILDPETDNKERSFWYCLPFKHL